MSHSPRRYLLLSTRPEAQEAEAEYQAFIRGTGLAPRELEHRRLSLDPVDPSDLERYDGTILGGSPYTFTDPVEAKGQRQLRVEALLTEIVDHAIAADLRFFGACHGIGAIGTRIGAVLGRDYSENTGTVPVTVTQAGRRDPLTRDLPERFSVVVGHKESIHSVPAGVDILLAGEACPVQMFRVGQNVYATQFHPELDLPALEQRMHTYMHAGYFHPQEMDRILVEAAGAEHRWASQVLANLVG